MKVKTPALTAAAAAAFAISAYAEEPEEGRAGNDVYIVGSSTVFPFSTKAAEVFTDNEMKKVKVISTGSGGGHKRFCAGVGTEHPDVTNSSRRQKKSEYRLCQANGVKEIVEVKIGFDGIVVANARRAPELNLSLRDLYYALAKEIPGEESADTDHCTFVANPYKTWSQVNESLPDMKIEVHGPPPSSGTRDAFAEIALDGGAKKVPCMKALRKADRDEFEKMARTIREDGGWADAGENDNKIVRTLVGNRNAMGVFGFSFLNQNQHKIKGANIDGSPPTFDNIATGDYPVSRSMYFYIKKAHAQDNPAIKAYALEFTSEKAWGPTGYLEKIGLIPLPDDQREEYRNAVENLTPYGGPVR